MIEKGTVFAVRQRERVVGRGGDAAVVRAAQVANTRIARHGFPQLFSDPGIGRRVVDDAELPVGVRLRAHGTDGRGKVLARRVEHRQEDRDEGAAGEREQACVERVGPGLVTGAPLGVIRVLLVLGRVPLEHAGERARANKLYCSARDGRELPGVDAGITQVTAQHTKPCGESRCAGHAAAL